MLNARTQLIGVLGPYCGLEHSGAFPPAVLLRTGTVRGPAVVVSRCSLVTFEAFFPVDRISVWVLYRSTQLQGFVGVL